MIIKDASIISKKFKFLIILISLILDLLLISLIILSTILTFFRENKIENFLSFIILLIVVLGALSIGDLILIIGYKNSIIFHIIKKIKTKNNSKSIYGFNIAQEQLTFCESVVGKKANEKTIYLYGNENKGKTTAIFYLIKCLYINSKTSEETKILNNIIFVDCKNNKDEIIDYFSENKLNLNRINKFYDKIIILDNIECLGSLFIESNIGLFSSERNSFILIEDTYNSNSIMKKEWIEKILCSYKLDYCSHEDIKINLLNIMSSFNDDEKIVFFVLYFLSLNITYIKKDILKDITNLSKLKIHKILKKFLKLHLYKEFPFNNQYIYCFDKKKFIEKEEFFLKEDKYFEVIELILKYKGIDSETKWCCFIRQDNNKIKKIPDYKKNKLFQKALKKGNYKFLYTDLIYIIRNENHKIDSFLYENGILSFYNGYHFEATQLFIKLIESTNESNKKKELMIRIIESSHGSTDSVIMSMINDFLDSLYNNKDIYSIYSLYWKIHISSERGLFYVNELVSIRNTLNNSYSSINDPLKKSIIQRTYTDEIRFNHILGNKNLDYLYDNYNEFLLSCDENRREYFRNLYVKANHIHYIDLLNLIIDNPYDQTIIEDLIIKADKYYDYALSCNYNDEKSKRATRIKQYELKMMYSNFDFEKTMNEIQKFCIHSEINKVEVHQAFCFTLFIKTLILNPNNFSNFTGFSIAKKEKKSIYIFAEKAKKIYIDYDNKYGVFRVDFILLLLELLLSSKNKQETIIKKIENLLKNNSLYIKEKKIFISLKKSYQNNVLTNMFIIAIIRAYPIILQ